MWIRSMSIIVCNKCQMEYCFPSSSLSASCATEHLDSLPLAVMRTPKLAHLCNACRHLSRTYLDVLAPSRNHREYLNDDVADASQSVISVSSVTGEFVEFRPMWCAVRRNPRINYTLYIH